MWDGGANGAPLTPFASMPMESEETRCRRSPGAHGFAPGDLYCHAPDNTIYRISSDGKSVVPFAKLPVASVSDGALAFDTTGRFGYELIAATGRSGAATPAGGRVYRISATGRVRGVGVYTAAGGADELAVAPAGFGTAAGDVVLTVDGSPGGSLVVVDPRGRTRTIATLPDGPNPVVSVEPSRRESAPGGAPAGLYVTDTLSHNVFFVSARQLHPYDGDLVVGTELKAQFWLVRPRGRGFQTRRLPTDLPAGAYNLEGATYVAG